MSPSDLPTALSGHGFPFDPAYGMGLAELLAVQPPAPPADFAAFWQGRYRQAMAVDPLPVVMATGRVLHDHAVHDLHYTSTDGVGIGGWLLLPRSGRVLRGAVLGHGYGECVGPAEALPLADAAILLSCFRGLGRSPLPGVSANPYHHVLHHIEDRERYILGGCVADLWLAVSALLRLFPQVAGHVAYLGSSFGGGIGALAAPWDARIARLHLEVPSFGHQALRLRLPCVGSGEAVRQYQQSHAFNVLETLNYYDAAAAARYLRMPTHIAAALFDPAVPPPGQFAIHNAVPAALRQLFVLQAGHFDYARQDEQRRALFDQLYAFFREL